VTRWVSTSLATALVLAIVALGYRARAAGDDEDMPVVKRKPRPSLSVPGKRVGEANGITRCGACHMVEGWEKVRFNHDPTGFPLRGSHVNVTCTGCHSQGFDKPVADTCSGCHRDRHAGEFGLHCEGCHDEKSWRPLFNANAHRSTNFPLVGRHALIPCTECHGNVRDRVFAQAAVRCDACHEADYMRTSTLAKSVDHSGNQFSRDCQSCHNTFRFFPATMYQHDKCFGISAGSHHAFRCMDCHTSLPSVTFTGTCGTGTFDCVDCHSHACARSDLQHKTVPGYGCFNERCKGCHSPLH
jgi:hypothetical protein